MGPAVSTPERIRELIGAGLNVARLNMSHGSHADHDHSYELIRAAAAAAGTPIAILADLQGPKIRLGNFADGPVTLAPGDTFVITTDVSCVGTAERCSTTYGGLTGDVGVGDSVLIDDGRIALRVVGVSGDDVTTTVVVGGPVSNHKGINLPGVAVNAPAMSEKDIDDLRWALVRGVDMIALSFVRSGADADDVRKVMDEVGVRLPIVAKLEKPQAIENLDEIIRSFDAFMVARGDLGVELPLEEVPLVQKRIIEAARTNAKPVIVATQMLESMISAPRPTRAEASDVANAVLDGADAVMLSGETSVGMYPVESVRTMARIIDAVEDHGLERMAAIDWTPRTKAGVICKAAAEVAERLEADYLVAFTSSGDTGRRLARYRSRVPMLAFTPDEASQRQMVLSWGIHAVLMPTVSHTDEMVLQVDRLLLERGWCQLGDTVVIVAGSPPGIPGSTNDLRVHRIGDAVGAEAPAYQALPAEVAQDLSR